jgi:AraC-like DNA-binding protein
MSVSGFHHTSGGHGDEPLAVPEAAAAPGGPPTDAGEGLDAASAGYRVGYDNASHFTREYKRLFGAPPMHDVEQLRQGTRVSASPEPIGAG